MGSMESYMPVFPDAVDDCEICAKAREELAFYLAVWSEYERLCSKEVEQRLKVGL